MLDRLIIEFDKGLRTLFAPAPTLRAYPDTGLDDTTMTDSERQVALGLMRVNHCGEVCAQALYQGQALTARDPAAREALKHAAWEETEHLSWTEKRIAELGGHKSVLNPVWYVGSLAMGITAGILGDKWNLGFLEETEYQVTAHLNHHLETLPTHDAKSRAIVTQMRDDELRHAETAHALGAAALPAPVKGLMFVTSQIMKKTSYWV